MPRQKISPIDLSLWCIFTIGAIIGIIIQVSYHKFINNDTLSYINIAELYASGKFDLALNGCWSPLYSWIVALFLLVGVPAIFTCYMLNFASAAICVYFLMKISRRYLTNKWFYFFFNLFSILWLLFYSLSALTPDLLAASAGVWMVSLVMSEKFNTSGKTAMFAGLAGAVMYFGKSYNLVFVTGFFLLLAVLAFINRRKRNACEYRSSVISLIVFFLISAIWIIPLSIQQGQISFSTAGPYVHKFMHPDNRVHPIVHKIIEPPYEEAYFAWIDPVKYLDGYEWSAFDNKRYFNYQVDVVKDSLYSWYYIVDFAHIKIILIIACMVVLFLRNRNGLKSVFTTMKIPLIVFIAYPLGYLFFFVLERYIFLSIMFFHLFLFYLLQTTLSQFRLRYVGLWVILLSGLMYLLLGKMAIDFWKTKTDLYQYYNSLYKRLPEVQFLQNKKIVADRNCFILGVQYCYRLKSKLYGGWDSTQQAIARRVGVQYLLTFKKQSVDGLIFEKEIQLYHATLNIYRIE